VTRRGLTALVVLLLAAAAPARADDRCAPTPPSARAAALALPNDNRTSAGRLRNGVLRVDLVARVVAWKPDGDAGCPLYVHAFSEEGRTPRIPGPLLRVRAGTQLVVRVRNALGTAIWVRGLQDRPLGAMDSTEIAAGASREFRFRATAPGAWYYWAGAAGRTAATFPMSTDDGQLVGALIVDPPGGPTHDRVFVMTRWTPRGRIGNADFQVNAINGRSWPNTERLAYTAGDSIRWHVVNASDELHMMHLHGFYFRVDVRGDAAHDSAIARARQTSLVTTATRRGEWMSITWSPERTGNWLFHCHIVAHMSPDQRVGRAATHDGAHASAPGGASPPHDMGGLILGVTVRPKRGEPARPAATPTAVRRLRVFANTRPRVYGERPGFGFVLQQGDEPPARDSIVVPGTPLVLTQGEPVAITVHNRTASGFSVHWHGIELESYFDGVAGWSGAGARVAPTIAPRDSFVARFTPPRAGTFIYHVHNEPGEELASGLYAPLLVLPPGARYDPELDRTIVVSTGGPGVDPPRAVNGKTSPDTITFVAGRTYRVRLIDISANEAHLVELVGPSGHSQWRLLARDGMDVPESRRVMSPARLAMAGGMTIDYELTLAQPGHYTFSLTPVLVGRPIGPPAVRAPVRVLGP
jgi:FtsP/CotA-like multicopper oxidase with cupredoxin domain